MLTTLNVLPVVIILLSFSFDYLSTSYVDKNEKRDENLPSKGDDQWIEDTSNEESDANSVEHSKEKRDAHPEYSYSLDSVYRPAHWPKYYKDCGGKMQSPIDIKLSSANKYKLTNPLRTTNIEAKALEVMAVHSGKTITWNFYYPCCRPKLYGGPMKSIYEFDSMHCHWGDKNDVGSEHLLNGKRFSMECHLIWFDVRHGSKSEAMKHKNGLVVMALLYKVNNDAPTIGIFQAAKHLPHWGNTTKLFYPNTYSVAEIIGMNRFPYAYYQGSLTTPPCSEHVLWVVVTKAVPIKEKQLQYFRNLKDENEHQLVNNFRQPQDMNDRELVLVST